MTSARAAPARTCSAAACHDSARSAHSICSPAIVSPSTASPPSVSRSSSDNATRWAASLGMHANTYRARGWRAAASVRGRTYPRTAVLHLHRADRADRLIGALASVLTAPPEDPLAAEVIAVPTRGVERWLTQRLAHALGAGAGGDGICANVAFPSPRRLVDEAVAAGAGGGPLRAPRPAARPPGARAGGV